VETEEAHLLALIENLPIGVIWVDAAGAIKLLNSAARQILKGIVGANPYSWLDNNYELLQMDGTPLCAGEGLLASTLRLGRAERNRLVRIRVKGPVERDLFLKINSNPLRNAGGGITGAVATVEDASQQRAAEEAVRAARLRARLMASLSRAFRETGSNYPAILHSIAQTVAEAIGQICLIWLAGGDPLHLRLAGWHHVRSEVFEALTPLLEDETVRIDASLEGQVFQTRAAVLVDAPAVQSLALAGEQWQHRLAQALVRSGMIAPLFSSDHALGVISVWRGPEQPAFQEEDLEFFQELAGRAALTVENARLYAEEVQRNRELNALRDATTALMSTLDLEVLLGRILDAAQRAVPAAERGLLFLAAPQTGRLEIRAMLGFNDPRIRRTDFLKNSSFQRVISERRPYLINDFFQESSARRAGGGQTPERAEVSEETTFFRSAMFAPLLLREDVLGVLALTSSKPFAFSEADLRLLVSFAATTTAALQNAMLHAEVQKIAITDALTGLYNRRGLEELGRHEVERFQRFGNPLSLTMFDIDFFKKVNDTYGHGIGDQILRGLADRCRGMIRQVDIFARYGGEEFVILLPETDLFQAVNMAERLRQATAETPFMTDQGPIPITISLGVTRASKNRSDLAALLEQADMALYDAKQKGRNRVEIG